MSFETKKANKRRKRSNLLTNMAFVGKGIDIGCGKDLLEKRAFKKITSIEGFDLEDGDAQNIDKYRDKESYDFVYSSNCLEHMENPTEALKSWYLLVKPEGFLVFTVPDEDLYEQGFYPSKFNKYHKWTFTIFKTKSWSPKSINIIDLLKKLEPVKVHKIETVDTKYDYNIKGVDQTKKKAEAFIEIVLQKKDE